MVVDFADTAKDYLEEDDFPGYYRNPTVTNRNSIFPENWEALKGEDFSSCNECYYNPYVNHPIAGDGWGTENEEVVN